MTTSVRGGDARSPLARCGYLVLPRGRPLLSYNANSIAHLRGAFVGPVRRLRTAARRRLHERVIERA